MSLKNSSTKSDYLEWSDAISLIQKLERDGNNSFALLVACGIFLGLRITDLKKLSWDGVLDKDTIELIEQKTGKRRIIKINGELAAIIKRIYSAEPKEEPILPLTIQYYNRKLKEIQILYRLRINHFSTHSFRKTFGRRVWQIDNHSEKSLLLLSEIFNHSGTQITRRYLGIRQEEISNVYDLL
jgi:integrase